ncbi:GNAT family N-acetyltransferase [Peptostreptococcus russellii]|uniref:GNAT family N-acetyltransferase n=1 Tax=Peptostreptococcus russellii TaxID=215200 RepID=UPI000D0E803C|nr:GNAT family N-acetyltransferase [Peptostreptococcus russellii]
MIVFKYFEEEHYDILLEMMLDFYSSDAVDHPIEKEIVVRLLEDILSGEHPIKGIEAYYNDKLVGFGVVTTYYTSEVAGTTVQLEDLFIQEEYRSRGIAKEYFKHVMESHPEAVRFRLEVSPSNVKAIKLYDAMGFRRLDYNQMILNRYTLLTDQTEEK